MRCDLRATLVGQTSRRDRLTLTILRASPLHAVHDLLRLGQELIEAAGSCLSFPTYIVGDTKVQKGGWRRCGGVSVLRYSSSSGVEVRPSISLRCGWRPKRAMTLRVALACEPSNSAPALR